MEEANGLSGVTRVGVAPFRKKTLAEGDQVVGGQPVVVMHPPEQERGPRRGEQWWPIQLIGPRARSNSSRKGILTALGPKMRSKEPIGVGIRACVGTASATAGRGGTDRSRASIKNLGSGRRMPSSLKSREDLDRVLEIPGSILRGFPGCPAQRRP